MTVNEILHGASHRKDMRWYGELRAVREKLRTMRPYLEPASHVPPFVIRSKPLPSSVRRVERELRRICPEFRIVQDPLTALDGMPCYHLYTEVPHGFADGVPKLVLEFSIQRDPTTAWPYGGPCTPDRSLVGFVRSVMKREDTQRRASRRAELEAREQAKEKEKQDMQAWMYRDFFRPYWVGGRVQGGYGGSTRGSTKFHTSKDRVRYFTPGRTGDHKSKRDLLREKMLRGEA